MTEPFVLDADGVDSAIKAVRSLAYFREVLEAEATIGGFRHPLPASDMRFLADCDGILRDADGLGIQIGRVDFSAGQVFRLFVAHGLKYAVAAQRLSVSRRTVVRHMVRAREVLVNDAELNAVLASLYDRAMSATSKRRGLDCRGE